MNRNIIKYIAAFTMFLDHFALQFFIADSLIYIIFRSLGRIAYVLFAYMIAEGFFKTSNLKNYYLRILGFAVIIEISIALIYFITGMNFLIHANVIWPLVIGLTCLVLLKAKKTWLRVLMLLPILGLLLLAEYLNTPYGAYGPLMIMFFALYQNKITQFLFVTALNLIFIEVPLLSYLGEGDLARYPSDMWWQWFSLLGFIFIFLYNGKKGKLNTKWFFYIFYPLHLGLIYLLDLIF